MIMKIEHIKWQTIVTKQLYPFVYEDFNQYPGLSLEEDTDTPPQWLEPRGEGIL